MWAGHPISIGEKCNPLPLVGKCTPLLLEGRRPIAIGGKVTLLLLVERAFPFAYGKGIARILYGYYNDAMGISKVYNKSNIRMISGEYQDIIRM